MKDLNQMTDALDVKCPVCEGSGVPDDGDEETCTTCQGSGVTADDEECPDCDGYGAAFDCPACGGEGVINSLAEEWLALHPHFANLDKMTGAQMLAALEREPDAVIALFERALEEDRKATALTVEKFARHLTRMAGRNDPARQISERLASLALTIGTGSNELQTIH
jgi:hypothetical protein